MNVFREFEMTCGKMLVGVPVEGVEWSTVLRLKSPSCSCLCESENVRIPVPNCGMRSLRQRTNRELGVVEVHAYLSFCSCMFYLVTSKVYSETWLRGVLNEETDKSS